MKIVFSFIIAFVLSVTLLSSFQAKASHMMGADISYSHISKNKYKIVLSFYRDCAGIAAPSSPSISIHNSCKNYNLTLTLTKVVSNCDSKVDSTTEVSNLCPNQIKKSTCNGGTLPGVQKCTYTGTIDLGDTCKDWVFSYTDCCRNSAITNLSSSGSTSMYVEAHLNNTFVDNYNNSSSIFTTKPVPYVCVGQQFYYNQGAFDPNGDSLSYNLFTPFSTDGKSHVTYGTGFSASYPISCTGKFVFNASTGQLVFTPSKAQVSVLAVRVDEFRKYKGKWVKVGSTERDIQLICIKCNSSSPITSPVLKLKGGSVIDSTTIGLCSGVPCSFSIAAADSDTTLAMIVTTNLTLVLPGATYNVHSTTKYQDSIDFTWTPSGTDTGLKNIVFTFTNSGCPVPGSTTRAYSIFVSPATYAGPDQFLCYGSKTGVHLKVVGGSKFKWSPPRGLSNDSSNNPIALPDTTTAYVVTSNLLSTCKNKDTVIVQVSKSIPHHVTPKDSAICFGDSTIITSYVTHFGGYTFSYTWSDSVATNLGNDSSLSVRPISKHTYFVKASNGLCPVYDTLTVNVHPMPQNKFSVASAAVCPGVPMTAGFTGSINGAYKFIWSFGGLNSGGILSGSGPITLSSINSGNYNVRLTVIDTGFLTMCTDTTNTEVTIYPKPVAGFSTIDTAGCVNYVVNIKNSTTGLTGSGNVYAWTLINNSGSQTSGDSMPSFTISTPGIYSVKLKVTNGDGCVDTFSKSNLIHVVAFPIASFMSDKHANDTIDLSIATINFTNNSQNATIYTWNFSDGTGNKNDTAMSVSHQYLKDGAFLARLKACDVYGCCDTTHALYTIYNFNDFFVPSAFTPNNDAVNDHLGILGKYVTKATLSVYDRWGNKVYQGNDKDIICNYHCHSLGWDGTFNGNKCPQGTYIWYAECDMVNGNHIKKKGDVTLIR